jgi:hypothetical protein
MPALIKSNSAEVSRSRPVLGFTVRTAPAQWFEVAIATDSRLFRPEEKARRTPANFFTSRSLGSLWSERGEAIWLVPPSVLARFVGQERLYYTIATSADPSFANPEVTRLPDGAVPSVAVSRSFTGDLRRLSGVPNTRGGLLGNGHGYGSEAPAVLEWAGDRAAPGAIEPAPGPAPAGNGGAPGAGAGSPPAVASVYEVYDDGLEPRLDAPSSPADEGEGDAEAYGIEGPPPEPVDSVASALGKPQPEYPPATRFEPAAPGNFETRKKPRTVDRIVIHITDATTTGSTVSWFQNTKARVSAHFVVGQDGEVVQMVRLADVAYHAKGANTRSIGIEHVAKAPSGSSAGLHPSPAQYAASAKLVRWLCDRLGIPVDRDHILGHAEIVKTDHTGCPNSVWDWDAYLGLLSQAPTAQGLGGPGSFDIDWPDVQVVPQPTDASCWATAAAIVMGWRDRQSVLPEHVATLTGHSKDAGIDPSDVGQLAKSCDLVAEPPQSYTVDGFRALLEQRGPLWVGVLTGSGSGHAVVVTGMWSDGNPDGSDTCVRVVDPWDRDPGQPCAPGPYLATHDRGSRYSQSWRDFVREYEGLGAAGAQGDLQIIDAGGTGGRVIASGLPTTGQSVRPSGFEAKALGGGAGVAVATEIVGAVAKAIIDNKGDVHWDLHQLEGVMHPGNDPANAVQAEFRSGETLKVTGPRMIVDWGKDDVIYLDCEMRWQYNGTSVGNVEIIERGLSDAVGGELYVKATLRPDLRIFRHPPDTGRPAAGLRVLFHYRWVFPLPWDDDEIKTTEYMLYGDGVWERVANWE